MPEPQVNELGQVALRHFNSNPVTVHVGEEKKSYSFSPKLSISMAWVDPKHVDALLSTKARICCGNTTKKFVLCNQMDVSLYMTGERPK